MNNDEDKEVDDNYVYTNENFYRKDDDDYLPPTTSKFYGLFSMQNSAISFLDSSLNYNTTKSASSYRPVDACQRSRNGKGLRSDDEIEEEFNSSAPCSPNKDTSNNSGLLRSNTI